MSILANITACLVLFFQPPIKIGDTIKVLDNGHAIEGELIDITYFFVFIRTVDRGIITMPNTVLLRSPFHIMEKHEVLQQ